MILTHIGDKIFKSKYALKDETWEEAVARVASNIASTEEDVARWTGEFYQYIVNGYFIPGGRILANAGTSIKNYMNCFALPVEDSRKSIYNTLGTASDIFSLGGGIGYNFSKLRERGAVMKSTGSDASGPTSFLELFDHTGEVIEQSSRRGAQMGMLNISHPDIEDFILQKKKLSDSNARIFGQLESQLSVSSTDYSIVELGYESSSEIEFLIKTKKALIDSQLTHFNLSVVLTNDFMEAVEKGLSWDLISPHTGEIKKTVKARELFHTLAKSAWESGDPGVFFLDSTNEDNMVPYVGELEIINPCLGGDTYLYNNFFNLQTMKNLDGITLGIYTVDNKGRKRIGSPSKVFKSGRKPLYRVNFSNGLFIDATKDHKITTLTGDKEVKDLVIKKDKIEFCTGSTKDIRNIVTPNYTEGDELFYEFAGFLFGDGTILEDGRVYLNLGKKDLSLLERYKPVFKAYNIEPKIHGGKEYAYYLGKGGTTFIKDYLLDVKPIIERQLPPYFYTMYLTAQPAKIAAFLRGLWGANGSVLKNYNRIQLKSANKRLVQDLQQYLASAIGIRSYISTNKETVVKFSNGEYLCKESYNLTTYTIDNIRFKEQIGFILPHHINNSESLVEGKYIKHPYVKSVEYLGVQDVYDFTEPITHHGIVNGIRVHNCGEVPLFPYESCCLGSINLHKLLNPETKSIDIQLLESVVRVGVRFLDNVQEISFTGIEEVDKIAKGLRRIGLGVMGWADLLAELEIPYGSQTAFDLGEKLSWLITFFAWSESLRLGEEKGVFGLFDPKKVEQRVMYKSINSKYSEIQMSEDEILEPRNVSVTSIAPTGSIALLVDVNSSIEPFYALSYRRFITRGLGEGDGDFVTQLNPILKRKLKKYGVKVDDVLSHVKRTGSVQGLKEVPEKLQQVFKTAHEITPANHIKAQQSWQSFVTNAVSKTINLKNTATVKEVEESYVQMWKAGLKGGTVYRDGSKGFQILQVGE